MSTEADARILIDRLLEQAGWCITNKAQVSTEEAAADGRADYLLKDTRSRPLAVLEAKRFAVDPYAAKEQAKAYALSLKAPFVILSNGQEHYFWDYTDGDARPVMGFLSQADLERRANIKVHRKGDIRQSLLLQPLPQLSRHPELSQGARAIFRNAAIVIPNGATLRRAVDIIAPISFLGMDADVKGDLFEYLASELGGQKKAAQFRTPRHLIRVITQMVDPQIGGAVCDPACGSGGFLIAAYEHILLANTSPEFIHEKVSPDGTVRRIGIGDKLSRAQWDFLQTGAFYGFDGDQDILRMAAMNAMLHGFDRCPMVQRDSICGGEDKWDEIQFDYILENPPFSGSRGDAKRSLRVEKGDKYVLFLAHALRSLRPGGTAGIIFPNGILFGDTGSHITVKERLLREFDLQAVVILPKGMFEPYTPNPTCFFIFRNSGRPTENVWFFKVDGDGSSLSKARKFGSQYRNDFPDLLAMWPERKTEEGRAWLVPAQRVIDNGYNMTLSGLGLIEAETVEHAEPEEILASVAAKEERILGLIAEMQELLAGGNGE